MRRFSRILVPVDLSDKGPRALQMAVDLAQGGEARIVLLHVIETIEGVGDDEVQGFYAELESRARAALEACVGAVDAGDALVEVRIAYGHRAREIVRQAEDLACDLIVLTSHRVDPEHPAGGIGTISHQVALVCDCPVLLIR